ncbi:heparin lyase I family protein [uncultured Ruegeria sp.]|uniref:heparin lyase I family protein n=1 Tax=uncultured Ruegeria sp. TaxID=259304 RepID=UPI00262530E9|nr:heparin lyase I family protein [uncultured Ruegeria sp.]
MPLVFLIAVLSLLATFSYLTPLSARQLPGYHFAAKVPHAHTKSKEQVRAGKWSQRFEVRAGDCGSDQGWNDCSSDRERSEITLQKRWTYGTDQWIGFSVFLPKDFKTSDRVRTTVGQIHQKGGPSGEAGGFKSNPPVVQQEMKGNQYFAKVHILSGDSKNVRNSDKRFELASISAMRGRWTDVVLHFDTKGDDEVLEVYINGQRKAYISDWLKFRPKNYSFKYGIYRSFVSRNNGPMPTQVIFFDEVRMGNKHSKVQVNTRRPTD